ncbi:winged helix-turn-helix domain-containing protein [Patescibacteria group bacterium]|nr:winged helix-turn-helix domain-containing protein [Patescibacteria group bacterium]
MDEFTFVKLLKQIFTQEGFLAKREIGVGYGVADLVLIKNTAINSNNCSIRKNHKQYTPLLNEKYFQTLKVLPDENDQDKSLPFSLIAKQTNFSESYLRYTILKKLERHGYVKKDGNKKYFKVNGWLPIANEVIAIEAKLKDWKRGAIQANRYRAFANKVYLAIPKETERLVDKKFLKKINVGLIILDVEKNAKRTVIASKKFKPLDEYKHHLAAEYFWNKRELINFTQI